MVVECARPSEPQQIMLIDGMNFVSCKGEPALQAGFPRPGDWRRKESTLSQGQKYQFIPHLCNADISLCPLI